MKTGPITLLAYGAAVLALASSGAAQASDMIEGQVLWGDLKTGMTKQLVKSLHPNGRIELSPGCLALIVPEYDKRRLASVTLQRASKSTASNCSLTVITSLISKYGEPRSDRERTERLDTSCYSKFACALRDAALASGAQTFRRLRLVTWFTGETLVSYEVEQGGDEWRVSYRQARAVAPDAAPKL